MTDRCRIMSVYNAREKKRYAVLDCPVCKGRMLVPLYAIEHKCERCGDDLVFDWGREAAGAKGARQ